MATLHLRIDNQEGRMVGFLDIPAEKLPDDLGKLEMEVQEKFAFPIKLEPKPFSSSDKLSGDAEPVVQKLGDN